MYEKVASIMKQKILIVSDIRLEKFEIIVGSFQLWNQNFMFATYLYFACLQFKNWPSIKLYGYSAMKSLILKISIRHPSLKGFIPKIDLANWWNYYRVCKIIGAALAEASSLKNFGRKLGSGRKLRWKERAGEWNFMLFICFSMKFRKWWSNYWFPIRYSNA